MSVYKDRLLQLATLLDSISLEAYNAEPWAQNVNGTPACNTVGCAIGWAATIPELQNLGMMMVNVNLNGDVYGTTYVCLQADAQNPDYILSNEDSQKVGMFVFGMTAEEYNSVFNASVACDWLGGSNSPDMNAGPAEHAAHIRSFVEAKYP